MKRWAIALTAAALIAALSLPLAGCVTSRTAPGPSASPGARQHKPAVVWENAAAVWENAGDAPPTWMNARIDCGDSFDDFEQNLFDTMLDGVPPQGSLEVLHDIYMLGFIKHRHIHGGVPQPEINGGALRISIFKDFYEICKANKRFSINDIVPIKNWVIKRFPHYYLEYVEDFEQGVRESLAKTIEREQKNAPLIRRNKQWMSSRIDCSGSFEEFNQNLFDTLLQDSVSPQMNLDMFNDMYIVSFIQYMKKYGRLPKPEINVEALRASFFRDLYAFCKTNKGFSLNDIAYIKKLAIKEFPHYYQAYENGFEQSVKKTLTITIEKERKNKAIIARNRLRSKSGQ